MEPYSKRQRVYSPVRRDFAQKLARQHDYYDQNDELDVEDIGQEIVDEPMYDPNLELQQRRAQLDGKLKSKFELLFEKYGRDFEGIGDEIDLATGEIVVNNGHIEDMIDEQDPGLRESDLSTDQDASTTPSEEEDSMEDGEDIESATDEDDGEDVGEDDETSSGDGMDDDDLILRGFAQANRFLHASPELGDESIMQSRFPHHDPMVLRSLPNGLSSAHSNLVAQFGPHLGAQIADYISQQEIPRAQSHVEPAWRVPELPSSGPAKRLETRYIAPLPEVERSLSPEASTSVWALPGAHRKRRTGGTGRSVEELGSSSKQNKAKRVRNNFSEKDMEVMLDFIATARKQGESLSSTILWKGLAAKYPHHSWDTWRQKCRRSFPYIWSNFGSEVSESEAGDDVQFQTLPKQQHRVEPEHLRQHHESVRPSRVRKPTQRDSRIISWSDAVDEIASLDPDLHAGIISDTARANASSSSYHEHFVPASRPRLSPNAPILTVQEPQPRRASLQYQRTQMDSFSDQAPPTRKRQTSRRESDLKASVPCPHAGCRQFPENKYKLSRSSEDEQSEMTLHLLRAHKTTPFPCGELNCPRKGEKGYFMQEDLVKHVKLTHPNISAMQRLRGRVDAALLVTAKDRSDRQKAVDDMDRAQSRRQQAVLQSLSDRVNASSEPCSSTPDQEAILTPNGYGHRIRGATSTPLTSFSSLKVNQTHTTSFPRREISDSQEPSDPLNGQNSNQEVRSGGHHVATSGIPPTPTGVGQSNIQQHIDFPARLNDSVRIREVEMNTRPVALKNRRTLPQNHQTNVTETSNQNPASMSDRRATINGNEETTLHAGGATRKSIGLLSSPKSQASNATIIPLSRSFVDLGTNSTSPKNIDPSALRSPEPLVRNPADPSHEFSDDEMTSEPGAKEPMSTSMVPLNTPGATNAKLPATPAPKQKLFKTIISKAIDQEDLDELSLGPDDFAIISSTTRADAKPTFGSDPLIKREGTVGPRLSSVAPSRKRKLVDLMQGSDEVDELGADERFGRSSGVESTKIKKETDLDQNITPIIHRIKAVRKRAMVDGPGISAKALPQLTSSTQYTRVGTPLLDLTPNNHSKHVPREIQNSQSSLLSSPSRRNENQQGDTNIDLSLEKLLTPTRSKNGRLGDLAVSKDTAIVVKTPGGTFKKCGDGEFRCGRNFCFRCSQSGSKRSDVNVVSNVD